MLLCLKRVHQVRFTFTSCCLFKTIRGVAHTNTNFAYALINEDSFCQSKMAQSQCSQSMRHGRRIEKRDLNGKLKEEWFGITLRPHSTFECQFRNS